MKIFSFSLCLFTLIFELSNQILKNNKLRNLDDEKNIIELELLYDSTGEVNFINNGFLEIIEKINVNGEEMTEKNSTISVNANEKYIITIKFQNDFEESCAYMFSEITIIKKNKI